MNEVYITGRGIVSPLGNTIAVNEAALRSGKSGTSTVPDFVAHELYSTVGGVAYIDPDPELIDRKKLRFCTQTSVMSIAAAKEAFAEAGLTPEDTRGKNIAMLSGVPDSNSQEIHDNSITYERSGFKIRTISPCAVSRIMPSSAVSLLSMTFGTVGESYDISAACSSSSVAIMNGVRLIRSGLYDQVLVGGAEEIDWCLTIGFCACRALSKNFNDAPERASRPFDRERDGFVMASGAAYILLESERSVKARGVRPICRVTGIGANSNALDMVVPDAGSSAAVMRMAIADAGLKPSDIGYINTHGTATPVGDPVEMAAIKEVFGSKVAINSTKSQTGHMIGATGAAEAIFTSIMLDKHFLSPSINCENPDPEFGWADIVRSCRTGTTEIRHALSNSFAFGGSNCALVLSEPGL